MSTSVTPQEVEHLRNRVALYLLVMLLIDLASWVSDVVSPMLIEGLVLPVLPPLAFTLRFAVSPLTALSWAVARFVRVGRLGLVLLECTVTLAIILAYTEIGSAYEPVYGPVFAMIGLILLLFVRASLVPSTVLRTVVIGVLGAGCFLYLANDEINAIGPVMRDGMTFMSAAVIVVTAINSRVIYGLRREVRQALQLGQYTLEEKLGAGGMGTVYRARHAMLRRQAAIKLIRADVFTDETSRSNARQRFEREAQATADLKSQHTVQLYDFGVSAQGAFYYVMELLDGVDLETVVKKYGPLPAERVAHILRQACDSLEEAHAAGLVHRDIKPANILLCHYGLRHDVVKVLDFGLVTLSAVPDATDAKLTADNATVGTPAYLAPEMISGKYPVDGRTDLYALGCLAYWLLTGHQPFERDTPMATILAHVNDVPTPPSKACELEIPPALDALVLDCLAKVPAQRPASAAEVQRRLTALSPTSIWTDERAASWWEAHKPERAPVERRVHETVNLTKQLT